MRLRASGWLDLHTLWEEEADLSRRETSLSQGWSDSGGSRAAFTERRVAQSGKSTAGAEVLSGVRGGVDTSSGWFREDSRTLGTAGQGQNHSQVPGCQDLPINMGPQGWEQRRKCHSRPCQLTSGQGPRGWSLLRVFQEKPGKHIPARIPTTPNCPRHRRLRDPQQGLSPLGATRTTHNDKCRQGPLTTLGSCEQWRKDRLQN